MTEVRNKEIGFIFQNYQLIPTYNLSNSIVQNNNTIYHQRESAFRQLLVAIFGQAPIYNAHNALRRLCHFQVVVNSIVILYNTI